MQSFLEKIVDEVLKEGKDRLSKYCFVFPTRRNGIYFRNILSKMIDSPIWSPEILSIEDFFGKLSPYTIADNLLLIFELHRVYGTTEAFDSFYSWGEMVLSDFDEVDKFLVPADVLFKKVKEFKDIDDAFPVELQDEFKKFWETIFNSKTDLKNDFVKIWEVLGEIYSKFNASLKSQGIAYKGMAYKEVCRRIINGEINFEWDKIIFAGFNSLNKCEEKIIQKLLDEGKAAIYWDSDEYYINDERQEAGHFLRKNFKTFRIKYSNGVENNLLTDKKNLSVTGIPLNMGQAKLTGKLLKELSSGKNFKSENTVLVLPDENMLLPVLYSLPDEIKELNVTMGFKFRNTPLFNLLMLIKSLLESKKGTGENIRFYHKDVSSILQHPYIKLFDSNCNYELVKEINKKNYVYVNRKNILKEKFPQILDIIFSDPTGIKDIFIYLRAIIDLIAGKFENNPSAYKNFQLEYIFSLYLQLNRFEDILNKYKTTVSPNMFWKILMEVLDNISIPFTGEPLKGLQIMGLLETRGLDFENVIILSVNEKIVPRGNFHNSFIPYPLRKAFKMPVYGDNDSITAYYFYRLLQRAKNINLIYNTDSDEKTGGISRFLLQIEYELSKRNPKINYSHNVAAADVIFTKKKEIRIKKTDEIIEKLLELQKFSASTIITFINCSLHFYFNKIAKLKEEESIEEVLDPASFGSLFHKVMEILYKPYINKKIDLDDLSEIHKKLESDYENIFDESLKALKKDNIDINYQGRNYLMKSIIKKLAEKAIEKDKEYVPITIKGLELAINQKLKIDNETEILLTGKIDRLEQKENVFRIIDYKTSMSALKKMKKNQSPDDYFESFITNSNYNETFQAFYYSYLYYKNHGNVKVNPALYIVRKASEGIKFLKDDFLSNEELNKFEEYLVKLFKDVFDKEKDFVQTEDERNCEYCEFKSICYRE